MIDALDGTAPNNQADDWAVSKNLAAGQMFSKNILRSISMYYKNEGLFGKCCIIPMPEWSETWCKRLNRVNVDSKCASKYLALAVPFEKSGILHPNAGSRLFA